MDGIAQRVPVLCESFDDRVSFTVHTFRSGADAAGDGEGLLLKAILVSTVTCLVTVRTSSGSMASANNVRLGI